MFYTNYVCLSLLINRIEGISMNSQNENNSSSKKNTKKLPKIGLRNLKTAISATLCVIIYSFVDRNPTFACIGAVFGMDNTIPSSFKTGGNRLIGTIIGGLFGMTFFSLSLIMPYPKISHMILLFVGIISLIYISQLLNFSGAIQAGAVVFFIVMLNTPEDQYFSYAINRIIDTGFGVLMSILINYIHITSPTKEL